MRSSVPLLASIILICFACTICAAEEASTSSSSSSSLTSSTAFNFYEYLEGSWEIARSQGVFSSNDLRYDSVQGRYNLLKQNGTSNLIGSYYENDTDSSEIQNQLSVEIEFHDTASGVFKTGEDSDSMKELFRFNFVQTAATVPISIGSWSGSESSYYSFQCISPNSFSITVFPKAFGQSGREDSDDSNSILIYNGRKIVPVAPKTFFQQYGSMLLIAGLFVFNMWIKTKQSGGHPSAAPAAATAAPRAVQGNGKKSN
jgi:hypothetical protein